MNIFELSGKIMLDDGPASKALDNIDKKGKTLEKRMKDVGKSMENMGKKMGKFVTLPVIAAFGGFAKAAMDLEATEAKYNTVFDGMTDVSDDFIKEFQKLTPATTAEARSMASGLQDLLVPMGMARDEATGMTGEMMHLSGALANFNSGTHSAVDVTNAMQSALLGQYQPLASLGIQLSKTEVQQRALEMGLADSTDELTKAHLATAMMELAYEQSGDALNAYTEDNLDLKTMLALAKAEIIDVAAAMGEHLMPFIEKGIEKVREITEWFGQLTESQQENIIKVMAIAAAMGPFLIVLGKITGAISTLKPVLAALTGPMGLVVIAVGILIAGLVHLWQTNEDFRDKVIEIWEKIQEFIGDASGNMEGFVQAAFDKIKEILEIFTAVIEQVVIPIIQTAYEIFQQVFPAVRDIIERVFKLIGDILHEFKYIILDIVYTVKNWMEENKALLMLIRVQFMRMVERVSEVLNILMGVIEWLWTKALNIWYKYGEFIMSFTKTAFDTIANVIRSVLDVINGVLDVFIGIFTGDWSRMWDGMSSVVKGAANGIIAIINGVIGAMESMVGALGKGLGSIPKIKIPKWVPGLGGKSFGLPSLPKPNFPRIPSLDVGTNKVLSDGLAMIHKGEEIKPAKHSGAYKGGDGNIDLQINLDGRQIMKALRVPMTKEIKLATGIRL